MKILNAFVWVAIIVCALFVYKMTRAAGMMNVGALMQPDGGASSPPAATSYILTEAGDTLTTEAGDKLRTETP